MVTDTSPSIWQVTPANLQISSTAIDVWRCPLDRPVDQASKLGRCLSEQEQRRAERFRFDDKRFQYIITRARLRQCLAIATGIEAGDLEIETAINGKPFLSAFPEVQFNVSHCDGLALIAVTREQPVGIDVETPGQNVQPERLAEHYFSSREKVAIAALPDDRVAASFFACWTRKEAVLKAIGTGIAHGLDSFEVATEPDTSRCQTRLKSDDGSVKAWWIDTLDCGIGFVGALAYQQQATEIRYWC